MRNISLAKASEVYNCASKITVAWHQVDHKDLRRFSILLKKFKTSLGDTGDNNIKKFTSYLGRYCYKLCAVPLAFNDSVLVKQSSLDKLADLLKYISNVHTGYFKEAKELVSLANKLSTSSTNPLLGCLLEFHVENKPRNSALLVKDTSLINHVEQVLARYQAVKDIKIVSPVQLRGGECYDQLFIIGPVKWFSYYNDYVINSPRAREIHIIKFSWIKDSWEPQPTFTNSNLPVNIPANVQPSNNTLQKDTSNINEHVDPGDLLPTIDWDNIYNSITRMEHSNYNNECVEARMFLLEGDGAVFLDISENSRSIVIDLEVDEIGESNNSSRVKKINNNEIKEGMYLLLRTSGGGDYIIDVANKILGEKASYAREMQEHWKKLLREHVSQRGTWEVSKTLKSLGSKIANEANTRNWMSSQNIKPSNFEDFEAITKLVGLHEQVEEYWKIATAIDKAHRSAGHHIRKLLLQKVNNTDLTILYKTGRMDFKLDHEDGGTLTAFRVHGKSPSTYTIPVSRVGHYFERDV